MYAKRSLQLKGLLWYNWLKICMAIALVTGFTSAAFLYALSAVTDLRELHREFLWGLPFAGIVIVFLYKYYGGNASKGNNLLFEEYYNPKGNIPLTMAPLVVIATLLTHLFGGSAGREGTAVQYGGTYADQIAKKLNLDKTQRRIALICGVAAGFASLFGTPLAGTAFAVEMFRCGKLRYQAFIPALFTAYLAHGISLLLKAPHTHYPLIQLEFGDIKHLLWVLLFGVLSGLVARLFIYTGETFSLAFKKINNPYWRVLIGAIIILSIVVIIGDTRHIGLGLPTILESFKEPQSGLDFLLKILLTCLTLSVGFKGGEVTPLFFIGATLASFMSVYIPIPLLLITGLGFVSVFSGCTKTPFACAVMAAELFGFHILPFALICTLIAAFTAGGKGIYQSQKHRKFKSKKTKVNSL
ncbi:chloride channel protein [Sphingobacterium luzhongxinii]|uniref:chloride channel protein n=1 Tax=Sphingobacterium luzhongxinii TaxID=2654181 RepID=UPI0013DABB8C|nr:chloride channel protein [Sphingobacterium sp. xlx-73]